MPFPPVERVIYKKNPLISVICQLRFPLDLRIDISMPAEFQQKIRSKFPNAQEDSDTPNMVVPDDVAKHFPKELLEILSERINRKFQFKTRDKVWTVTLTNHFVALETSEYTRWEDFRTSLELVVSAICNTYQFSFFTRVGLRYQNVVDRKVLGLVDSAWNDLLSDFVLGPLSQTGSFESAQEHNGSFLIQLDSLEDLVRVQYGLVAEKTGDPTNVMFLLDQDFFTENDVETEASDVIKRLNIYNSSNRRLFRRCITDKLHDTLEPETTDNRL